MSKEGDGWQIPKEVKPRIDVVVNTSAFADRLARLGNEAEYPIGVFNKSLQIGHWLFTAEAGTHYVLRDGAGFEQPVSIIDDMFSYDGDAEMTYSDGKVSKIKRKIHYKGRAREYYMNRANAFNMDLEEVAAREIMAGLYIMEQTKDGNKGLAKIEDGRRIFMDTRLPSPKEEVKNELWKYYEKVVEEWKEAGHLSR